MLWNHFTPESEMKIGQSKTLRPTKEDMKRHFNGEGWNVTDSGLAFQIQYSPDDLHHAVTTIDIDPQSGKTTAVSRELESNAGLNAENITRGSTTSIQRGTVRRLLSTAPVVRVERAIPIGKNFLNIAKTSYVDINLSNGTFRSGHTLRRGR